MKFSILQQNFNNRRSNSFRQTNSIDSSSVLDSKSPASLFWLVLHGLCCLISLVLGFRFSRIIFFLLFSSTTIDHFTSSTPFFKTDSQTLAFHHQTPPSTSSSLVNLETSLNLSKSSNTRSSSGVVVGRHGILIRPWPHPNPTEVMKAHRIMERVQKEQRVQYGIKNPRNLIVITPTYVRTFQTLHLTGLMHSLMLVPYDLVWIVVEAGGTSNETASILEKSRLQTIHIGFDEKMPISWDERHQMEARMRFKGLRVVREERLDGIVMFADDSNMHSMELFDEIQSVKWMGAVSVGILAHSANSVESFSLTQMEEDEENVPMPVQGPACNSSGQLAGWHTFNSLPYVEKSATYIDDMAMVLPRKLEWAGFVLNSRLLWKEAEDKPEWIRDLDTLVDDGDALESPLSLLKDSSSVEPLGNCGRKVLLWWLRVEARADSKFPPGWIIDPPLEITVPSKRTPWPDAPPELPSDEKLNGVQEHTEKHNPKTGRTSRSRHGSRTKKKHDSRLLDTQGSGRRGEEK
ncbi:Nucleotide-diphospho-sugar transferases superfamily protein [Thalictrum thalictroides]|uniref:Glycosyltransferases n=1 Tax=Thalictrum thalictroides TaxID=46969 RepID=A0A7J6WIG7_THATH|nr:Nucleotide-diphospho-sugar transferases superfamily protein [Thalictrum thalictroides]